MDARQPKAGEERKFLSRKGSLELKMTSGLYEVSTSTRIREGRSKPNGEAFQIVAVGSYSAHAKQGSPQAVTPPLSPLLPKSRWSCAPTCRDRGGSTGRPQGAQQPTKGRRGYPTADGVRPRARPHADLRTDSLDIDETAHIEVERSNLVD